ncbi:putative DNA binding protein [Listeria phage vB_Liva_VAfA18]|uniref:Putative DNA binding protein n=1 Tax=Listeria phage vB_Liva_VAfA18 TaxID=2712945 RepID=A0A858EEC3_9CAUD|nr:putative DNA binding protein [Listeria phage vB_Liva_VAfA18]
MDLVYVGCQMEIGMRKGLRDFLVDVAKTAQQWGESVAMVTQKHSLAEKTGVNIRTVSRYIAELENKGIIKTEAKRGRNGGLVIMFNKNMVTFKLTDNPITSDSPDAIELRDRMFPKKNEDPNKEKRPRRTKEQMAEEKVLKNRKRSLNNELNDMLDDTLFPTEEIFNKTEEPERYFKAYLLSRMVNAYAYIYPTERELDMLSRGVQVEAEKARKNRVRAYSFNSLPARFFGTSQFTCYLKLQDLLEKENINPLSYLTVQFDYLDYRLDNSLGGTPLAYRGIPEANCLIGETAFSRYTSAKDFYTVMRGKNMLRTSTADVAFKGGKYPIVEALLHAYNVGKQDITALNQQIEDMKTQASVFHKSEALADFYETTKLLVEESALETNEKDELYKFVTEQVVLHSRKNAMSLSQQLLSFPLQIQRVRQTAELKGLDKKDYYTFVGNLEKQVKVSRNTFNSFTEKGKLLHESLEANSTFYSTIRMLGDYRGLTVNIPLLGEAIKKLGEEHIPLDSYGMLDITQVYDKYLTDLQMQEDEENYETPTSFIVK